MFKVDQNYTRRDGSLDGRLDMSNHRISGLADPICYVLDTQPNKVGSSSELIYFYEAAEYHTRQL